MSEFGKKEIVRQGFSLEELKEGLQVMIDNQVIIAELEKIKAEMEDLLYSHIGAYRVNCEDLIDIIDNHIKELKEGEETFNRKDNYCYEEIFCEARDCGECAFREREGD